MEKQNLQAKMAQFISALQYEAVPAEVIADAKYRVLDWVGCALAGARYKPSLMVAEMVREAGGAPQASVIRGGAKVPVAQAALANGVIGHVAEFDDGHRLAIAHPGAVTVPVALAMAEYCRSSGKELLTAVVAGYEVLNRLGAAVNPAHYKVWHTTATCGTFAAAATAAKLLGLNAGQTQMALGIAGTMAAGLQETFGTYAKPLNAGHACQSGIQAALLAQRGFTGPEDIIMGKKGFVQATADQYDVRWLEEIGSAPLFANSAFYKVYASCGHTNSPLDVIFNIQREHQIDHREIKSVTISTYRTSVELTGQFKNQTEDQAKFSLPYCIAAALLYKKITLAEFRPEILASEELKNLAGKIQVQEDPEATKLFPQRKATITIEMANGQRIVDGVETANDVPQYEALDAKFLSLAASCLEPAAAETVKCIVLAMEQLQGTEKIMEYLQ